MAEGFVENVGGFSMRAARVLTWVVGAAVIIYCGYVYFEVVTVIRTAEKPDFWSRGILAPLFFGAFLLACAIVQIVCSIRMKPGRVVYPVMVLILGAIEAFVALFVNQQTIARAEIRGYLARNFRVNSQGGGSDRAIDPTLFYPYLNSMLFMAVLALLIFFLVRVLMGHYALLLRDGAVVSSGRREEGISRACVRVAAIMAGALALALNACELFRGAWFWQWLAMGGSESVWLGPVRDIFFSWAFALGFIWCGFRARGKAAVVVPLVLALAQLVGLIDLHFTYLSSGNWLDFAMLRGSLSGSPMAELLKAVFLIGHVQVVVFVVLIVAAFRVLLGYDGAPSLVPAVSVGAYRLTGDRIAAMTLATAVGLYCVATGVMQIAMESVDWNLRWGYSISAGEIQERVLVNGGIATAYLMCGIFYVAGGLRLIRAMASPPMVLLALASIHLILLILALRAFYEPVGIRGPGDELAWAIRGFGVDIDAEHMIWIVTSLIEVLMVMVLLTIRILREKSPLAAFPVEGMGRGAVVPIMSEGK